MDWLQHPRFANERTRAINQLRDDKYDFHRIKKVVFLCGGLASPRRDTLNAYFQRHIPDCLVFYAEAAWAVIASLTTSTNALAVEEKLADLADIVVIIVESPGTFAEVGAFAMSERLRAKLLPILDSRHRSRESFIATGPIRWVDAESTFKPTIWTDLDQILNATGELEERLSRLKKSTPTRVSDLLSSPKHVLFFVCDLVAVFGPCPRDHMVANLKDLLGARAPEVDIDLYLGLGRAMNLLGSFRVADRDMFFRVLDDGRLSSFQRRRHIDLSTLRAGVLSAMQACGLCDVVLAELARQA
ncbi:MAG: retron St85 family effector protein [Pirellulales bacterium]